MSRPWSFDINLFCLNSFDGSCSPQETTFYKEPIWVQIYNMPFGDMAPGIGGQLGIVIGDEVEVDVDDDGIRWGPCLRVKIQLDVTKPLLRGSFVNKGNKVWLSFKYERLPYFCFKCGIIKHGDSGCSKAVLARNLGDGDQNQYGAGFEHLLEKLSQISPTIARAARRTLVKGRKLNKKNMLMWLGFLTIMVQ